MASDNKVLGQFDLVGIPSAPRGMPQIEVTFDIDANGIVNVSAKDKATGKEQQIRIQASGGLSDEDIEKMVSEAEEHAGEDKKRRELTEAKNNASSLIYSTEKSLEEFGEQIGKSEKETIEQDVSVLKEALEADDVDAITKGVEALTQSSMKLGEAMYKASQEEAAASSSSSGEGAEGAGDEGPKADDVVDVDVEEVDEKVEGKEKKTGS